MAEWYPWLLVGVIALVTALLRFLPFWLFAGKGKTPKLLERLSKSLPFAAMGMLVVYCLRQVSFSTLAGFLPSLIAGAVAVLIHWWRRNTLLSILCSTLCYMLLVQGVF